MAVPVVTVLPLGLVRYRAGLALQHRLVERLQRGQAGHTLVLLQHNPVYTTGMRTKGYTQEEETRLAGLGADFVRTNRGGLITFHGPGQLVAYPVLDLRQFLPHHNPAARKQILGMKWYVHQLEEMVIRLVRDWGVEGVRSPHTGVWVGNSKICAMGVHNSNLVTSHGLALNCDTDLAWFQNIVPCGIQGAGVTSLTRECGERVGVEQVQDSLVQQFAETFQCDTVTAEPGLVSELLSSLD